MDFVVTTEALPSIGQTVLGKNFRMLPGGKGANQACAAGRLSVGTQVRMVGRVGADVFGEQLRASLSGAGVDVSTVLVDNREATGVAFIEVDAKAQNTIVVASGANFLLAEADVTSTPSVYANAGIALFQLETPLGTVRAALESARQHGAKTILDPAPAQALTRDILELVDVLTPNESEACILLGRAPASLGEHEVEAVAGTLLQLGPQAILLKLGSAGCFYLDRSQRLTVPAFVVEPVDTTAAGDTFNAALAVAMAEGQPLPDALRFACAAAAISVTREGAQSSIPSRTETDALLLSGTEGGPAVV